MIRVVLNPHRLSLEGLPEDARVLDNVLDYTPALRAIRGCLHSDSSLVIHARHPAVCRWVRDYLQGYKEVTVEEADPEAMLRDRWRIGALPPELNSRVILQLCLLEKPEPQGILEDIKGYVLGQCVGPCWEEQSPSWEHFGALVTSYFEKGALRKLPSPLDKWLQERQMLWCRTATGDLKLAYEWLSEKPAARSQLVARLKVLSNYPKNMQVEWVSSLEERYLPAFVDVGRLPRISLPAHVASILSHQAKAYWKSRLVDSPSVVQVLPEMSGELMGEIEAIYLYFLENIGECDLVTISELRKRFDSLDEATGLIGELDARVPKSCVPAPPDPERTWQWREWAEWVTQEYLPYRSELQHADRGSTEVDEYVRRYEDWVYNQYPTLKYDAATPLVHAIVKHVEKTIDEGFVVLWVIVDNLDWQHAMDLIRHMNKEGLFLIGDPHPRLSMLPSETFISKTALLSGRLPAETGEPADLGALLRSRWGEDTVAFARNEPSLSRLVAQDAGLYVYMYDDLDRLAHGQWVEREGLIQYSLRWLARMVSEAVRVLATKGKVRVMVSSDHGSVKLPDGAHRAVRPAYSKLDEEHARFAVVPDASALDPGQWYILGRTEFGLTEDYAIPKGYTYIEVKPRGLTHGGLTPEETIVAHLEFQLQPQPWLPLALLYRGSPLNLGREQKIRLVLMNPNLVTLFRVRIQIPSQVLEAQLLRVPPESECLTNEISVFLPPKAPVTTGEEVLVQALILFNAYGSAQCQDAMLRLPIMRLWRPSEMDIFGEGA